MTLKWFWNKLETILKWAWNHLAILLTWPWNNLIFNRRSLEPKIEEPPIFDLRPWIMIRRSHGRRGKAGGTSSFEERRTPHLPHSRLEERIIPHLPSSRGRIDEEPSLVRLLPIPPTLEHQLPSGILRSGSSDRSSTMKIGPKIEIGSLLSAVRNKCLSNFLLIALSFKRH